MGKTLTMPSKDARANEVNVYSYEGVLSAHGYAVDIESIKSVPVLLSDPVLVTLPQPPGVDYSKISQPSINVVVTPKEY